jgi:NADH-quinone oxidoreductase subunit M
MDGLSLALVLLTAFLGLMAVLASWTEIRERVGLYYCCLLWTLTGVVGLFLAMDLFLFFLFWEAMLIPMYLLIVLWGHERRFAAGYKFMLFTQAGSLSLLVAIIALAFLHQTQTGSWTFDYVALLGTRTDDAVGLWLMLGFFAAFAVKLPVFPLHPWLPDAHTEAPTGGSVILAGLLLKTGAYGLIRFVVPLFPEASRSVAPVMLWLGVIGIGYGAFLAFAQQDMKRLVAYSSISHLGFVLIGIFTFRRTAMDGAVMQMVAHGFSTGALFMLVGALQERLQTRDLSRMGGLWRDVPRLASLLLFFAVASLGLPGLGNFIGEFLILFGSFKVMPWATAAATLGLVLAAVYALALVQRALHGPPPATARGPDLAAFGTWPLATMAALLLWLGLYPQPLFTMVSPSLEHIERIAQPAKEALR